MHTTYHHHSDRLWDADPHVCCAAFQLGACPHTEGEDDPGVDALELEAAWRAEFPEEAARQDAAHAAYLARLDAERAAADLDNEPF